MEGIREQDEGHAADVAPSEDGSIPFGETGKDDESDEAKWFDPEPDQTLAELEAQLTAVSTGNQSQTRELKMYTDWLSNHKEEMILRGSPETDGAQKSQSSSRKSSRRGKSRTSNRGGGATTRYGGAWARTLTSLEKCTISNKEFEEVQKVQTQSISNWDHTLGVLSAEIEERRLAEEGIAISTGEALKDLAKLDLSKHNLLAGPQIKLTSLRIQRAHEETLKAMVGQVGKLALKSSSVKTRSKVVKATLKAKEEGGEDLRRVDYDKLKILNQELIEELHKKNRDLHKYKVQTSSLSHKADHVHDRIRESSAISDKLTKATNSMLYHKHRGEAEYEQILQEQKEIKTVIGQNQELMAKNKVPSVLSYVGMGAELLEVKRQIHMWSQHSKTAATHAKRAKSAWREQRRAYGAESAPARYRSELQEGGRLQRRRPLVVAGVESPGNGARSGYTGSLRAAGGPRSLSARSSLDRRQPGLLLPPIF